MSDQVRALKDKATELTTKGKFPAAIEAWQKVVAAAPDDVGALLMVAVTFGVGRVLEPARRDRRSVGWKRSTWWWRAWFAGGDGNGTVSTSEPTRGRSRSNSGRSDLDA